MKDLVKFNPIVTELRRAVVPMMEMTVTDQESKEQAELALRTIKGYEKKTEDVHAEYKAPILEAGRALDQKKRDIITELGKPKAHLTDILVKHQRKVIAEQEAERKRIEQEKRANAMKAAEAMADVDVMAPNAKIRAEEQNRIAAEARAKQEELADQKKALNTATVSGVRKNWKWTFLNPMKTGVKPEFMVPDETAIGKTVRANGERAAAIVGGIEVWAEESIASGSIMPQQQMGKRLT